MSKAFVGFYWTLPVNWAGFRRLPATVDDAAAVSRTIGYQREQVRRFVAAERGTLVDEIAFMDVQSDRATDAVEQELQTRAARHAGRATLLYVRFEEAHSWPRNTFLVHTAERLRLELLPLPPDPVIIDGQDFDPARHFAEWRKRDASTKAQLAFDARRGLRGALSAEPEGDGRWQTIADRLNADGVRTIRGGQWTRENVRKLARQLQHEGG